MKYTTADAFRTALEQRLLTLSGKTNVPVQRLRKLVVFDRLLARLIIVAPNRWILKGAVALAFRGGMEFRNTKDLDIGRFDDEREALTDFFAAQNLELGDHFHFLIERTAKLDSVLEGAAVRYHVAARLAGRRFEDLIVDVGFSHSLSSTPEVLRGPDLLLFADIPPAEVPTIPLEFHITEKMHAYTRCYGDDRPSTRVKDIVDLTLISFHFPVPAGRLRDAVRFTFDSRGSHSVPARLPSPPSQWTAPYARMAAEVGLDPDLLVGYEQARAFLDPILSGAVPDSATWDPSQQKW